MTEWVHRQWKRKPDQPIVLDLPTVKLRETSMIGSKQHLASRITTEKTGTHYGTACGSLHLANQKQDTSLSGAFHSFPMSRKAM